MEQINNGNQEQSIKNLLNKVVMPVFKKEALFEFTNEYIAVFENYLRKKYPHKILSASDLLKPIVKFFYPEERNIKSILIAEQASEAEWNRILENIAIISDFRKNVVTRQNSAFSFDLGEVNNVSTQSRSPNNLQSVQGNKRNLADESQVPMWSDALNYHFSFQGFMETVREFEMFATAYSRFLANEQTLNKKEVTIYKYQLSSIVESTDKLTEEEMNHLTANDCYCKDKDNIYFTANYLNGEIIDFFETTKPKVFNIINKVVKEFDKKLSDAEKTQLSNTGYYNSNGAILFTRKALALLYNKQNSINPNENTIKRYFEEENDAIVEASSVANQYFSKGLVSAENGSKEISKAKLKAKLIELTSKYTEEFAKRTISNFKFLCEKQIKNLLDAQIKEVVIPSGANKMKEILQFLGGAGVEELKRIDEDFNDQLNATQKLIDEEYRTLQNLYINNKKNGVKFNKQVFNEAKQVFSTQITKCFNELKADLSSAIKEKTLFIDQVKEQYVGALKEALGKKDNNDFTFLYQQYESSLDKNSLDNNIYNKLPKWIQQGVDGFTTELTIHGRKVRFILNKSQKTIIEKLKEFANPSNEARSQTQIFYLGTGGGKTYLLNELISGAGTSKILGSDGIEYSAEDIKKAIFGDSEPHIISINFHQIKGLKDFQRHLEKFNDPSKKRILILDEYHLFPKEVRNNLKDILKDKNIFVIKSTATPTPEELYYKNLKIEILGNGGTKKLSKDTYNEIQGKINLFLEYNKAQHNRFDKNKNVANNNKKYHLIIDSTMISDDLVMNGKIENCNINASITNEKPDIKIFGFKNEENQEQFFIEEKQSDGGYKKVGCKVSDGYSRKNFSKSDLKEYLNKKENKEKKYQIYYPDSISAGGDFGIADGVGKTKISIVIDEDLLTKPATEIVNYILQALGRDRFFDFTQSNSFANVKFIGKDGSDKTDVIKQKFEEAQKFYNKKEGDANPLFDYLQNKFKSIDDKKYIALFCKIIKDNSQKNTLNLIESLKKSFDNPKDFKKFESRFVAASIIQQFEGCDHVFAKDIKETANKIINSNCELQDEKIIDSFKGKLGAKGVFFENGVSFNADIFFEDVGTQIVVNYKIKVTTSGDAIFSINSDKQMETVSNLLANCGIEVTTKEFLYNQTLKSLEVEKANAIPTVKYNASRKKFEYNSNVIEISCVDSVSKINHKEGDKDISLEAKAIAHLFNKVLDSKDDDKFTKENKELIKEFFKNNPVKLKQQIFDVLSNSSSGSKSNNAAAGSSGEQNNSQIISGRQQTDQVLTAKQKLEIIKTALSQRNKYNADDSKNTDENRAQGTGYKKLKTTLQALNDNNINFTTESLKLFNNGNTTLGTCKEVDNLIGKKPLFVRAMASADINKFKKITKNSLEVNEPSHNILLAKPELASSLGMIVKLTNLKNNINKTQQK